MKGHWRAALKILALLSSFYYHELEHSTEHLHPEKIKIERRGEEKRQDERRPVTRIPRG
jgi:hypothetical protein